MGTPSEPPRTLEVCDPDLLLPDAGCAVVVDVLRATTTVLHALEAGALEVIPCAGLDEARELRQLAGEGEAVLCGERDGIAQAGFDTGNSPAEMTPERVGGRRVVLTTTNGTRALEAVRDTEVVLTACFANRTAVANWIHEHTRGPVALVCAGRRGGSGADDELFAGSLIARLPSGGFLLGPRARAAASLWSDELEHPERLASALLATEAGAWLAGLGFERDVRDAAQLDRSALVPRLERRRAFGASRLALRAR